MASTFKRLVIWQSVFVFFGTGSSVKVRVRDRVRVRFRGRYRCRFRWQLIVDSWLPVHVPGIAVRLPLHDTRPSLSSSSIYFAILSYQIADIYHAMAGQQINTKLNYSWRPIINRTVVNILLRKNIQWNKKKQKKTNRHRTRQRTT